MLPGVLEPFARDLRELACPIETGGSERIAARSVDLPISRGSSVAKWVQGLTVIEEAFVGTVPRVRLLWEGVGCVWRPLVMAMYLRIINKCYLKGTRFRTFST